jgi:hypothetical protein
MQMTNNTLARRTLALVLTGAGLLHGADARAAVTTYASEAVFSADATAAGLSLKAIETFEENEVPTGTASGVGSPLMSGVANGLFPAGLSAPGLAVFGQNLLAQKRTMSHIESTIVGADWPPSSTRLELGVETRAIAFDVYATSPTLDAIEYFLMSAAGDPIDEGTVAMPAAGSDGGNFFGIISDEPFGSIEIRGFDIGVPTPEYVDDVRIWGACPQDTDGDGAVGFADLSKLLALWGPCDACGLDVDGNGVIGFPDLTGLLGVWGDCV